MAKIRVIQIPQKGAPFELTERDLPEPGHGEVRVKVQACGVCHSDSIAVQGLFPNIPYPIVPGHEIAGVIDAIGPGVIGWSKGARVGVGWFGGNCGHC
jgi:D-arabinose 1-dehydrogenase-like Zn-dependent alcohol dehydrogenase